MEEPEALPGPVEAGVITPGAESGECPTDSAGVVTLVAKLPLRGRPPSADKVTSSVEMLRNRGEVALLRVKVRVWRAFGVAFVGVGVELEGRRLFGLRSAARFGSRPPRLRDIFDSSCSTSAITLREPVAAGAENDLSTTVGTVLLLGSMTDSSSSKSPPTNSFPSLFSNAASMASTSMWYEANEVSCPIVSGDSKPSCTSGNPARRALDLGELEEGTTNSVANGDGA